MATVFANIGGNIGNVRLNIAKAISAIGKEFGEYKISNLVESEPWGFTSASSFFNIGISFQSNKTPHEILRLLQEIERKISEKPHRNPDGSYSDREIDIDIMAIDSEIINEIDLIIPHPRLSQRKFFLLPLYQLAPEWHDPSTGLSVEEMIRKLDA